MTSGGRVLWAVLIVAAGIGLAPKSPSAFTPHFVVVSDNELISNNTATVLALEGSPSQPSLVPRRTLLTGGASYGEGGATVMLQHGSEACIYVSETDPADIAAFIYPSFSHVGRYIPPGILESPPYGVPLAARSNYVFAAYEGDAQNYIAVWKINDGCGLTLASETNIPSTVSGMAVTPDGNTLVVTYSMGDCAVTTFTVEPDGTLGPHPIHFTPFSLPESIDITADGKYAIVAEMPENGLETKTEIGIWTINSGGTLGQEYDYGGDGSLGPGFSTWIWLSPNEKFLFVTGGGSGTPVTTLNFDESVPKVTYKGCLITPREVRASWRQLFRPGQEAFSTSPTLSPGAVRCRCFQSIPPPAASQLFPDRLSRLGNMAQPHP